jgi:fermentation-respiration switch protein FrsA (DUF1100 family)
MRSGVAAIGGPDTLAKNASRTSSPSAATVRCISTLKRLGLPVLAVVVVAAGCRDTAADSDVSIATPLRTPVPAIAPDVWDTRGAIVEKTDLTAHFDDPDNVIGQAWRAVYRSASGIDGGARVVSGVFLVPRGSPPPGGWPVISMAHGTTGIGADCGPSRDATLMGFLPAVMAYLADGYAIAMSDYEGLGEPGRHPYLEPRTSAFNITDAVRALHSIFPNVSTRWVAFGNSQGGQAVWAANEIAGWYGTGVDLIGTVALSPAANITALADLAHNHSLSTDQQAVAPLIVEGLQRFIPGLGDHSLLPDVASAQKEEMFSCQPEANTLRQELLPQAGIRVDDQATTALLRDALRRIALPQGPLNAPMLVINGLADKTIPPSWVAAAVDEACELGGQIQHFEVAGVGHADLGAQAYDAAASWVHQRFDSQSAPSNCGAAPAILS